MSDITADAIALESAIERLRQERETFNQNLQHTERWFRLRLLMGYAAVALLPIIAVISGFIIINPASYSAATVTAATGALFADVLGLLASIWKVVLNPASISKLAPITAASVVTGKRTKALPPG